MKKYVSLILTAVIILVSFVGCSSEYENGMTPGRIAKTLGPQIVDYINNNDSESMKALYSEEVHNTSSCDLDEELQKLFDFVNGNITSYSIRMGSESSSGEKGKIVKNNFDVRIEDVQTDTGETYIIVFGYISVDSDQPDCVGMYRLSVYDNDDYNISAHAGSLH